MATELTIEQLLAAIKSDDPDTRTNAWLHAGQLGAKPLKPLAEIVTSGPLEVSRAAKRAMWKIVRTAGAPDASGKEDVCAELVDLLDDSQSVAIRRETLWMLSEIGGDQQVPAIADLLGDKELCEDTRMVLERIPGDVSLAALKTGFAKATEQFKPNIAQSLRKRGVTVDGYPCQKLVPTRETKVKAL
jgi:HEAT repeat protein